MALSLFLARFFGLYLVIMGVFCLARKKYVQQIVTEFFNQKALVMVGGVMSLIIGLLLVLSHSVWTLDWRVIITLLGYLSLLKGLVRLFVDTDSEKRWSLKLVDGNKPIYFGIAYLIIGLYLTYRGFSG